MPSGLDVTFLNNITRQKFIPALKNVLYNQSPLFNRLFVKGRVQNLTGTGLQWDVVIKKHAAVGRFTGYDVFANQPINPTVQATLSEGAYYAALAISGTEKRKNTGNMEKLLDAVKTQHDNAIATLKDMMYTDAYGSGALVGGRQGLIGMSAAVSASNVYANIDRSVTANASWQANVNSTSLTIANLKDPTSTQWMPSVMRNLYTSCTHDHAPDLIILNKTQYNLYQDIAGLMNLRFDNDVANLGFGGVQFGPGVTIIFDDFIPNAVSYFINISDWSVFVYPGANFDMPEEGWMRPQNQDAVITQIIWQGQMRLDSPWHQGTFTSLGAS
jgi:hypothetical protein